MPQYLLSQIKALPFDFEQAVRDFVQAKKDHLSTEGVPAPTAHHMVEDAVTRIPGTVEFDDDGAARPDTHQPDDFVENYEIVPDPEPPPLTLEERRAAVAAQISADARAAVAKITPPLKARLWQIHLSEAIAVPEADRTDAQKVTIAENAVRARREYLIHRHLAEMESQLHDLPDDMVDIWRPAPFPE
jgi:hypothetical protein